MLNKAILMGRLTADPELRRTQTDKSVSSFTLAVSRDYGQDQTDFLDVVAWGNTAEFVTKWFKKGMLVAVCGRIQTRSWKDKNGQNRKAVEVIAEEVHFAEPKPGNNTQTNEPELRDITDEDDGDLPFNFGL